MEIREALYNDIDGIIDVNIATWFTAHRGIIKDETLQKRVTRREKQIRWRSITNGLTLSWSLYKITLVIRQRLAKPSNSFSVTWPINFFLKKGVGKIVESFLGRDIDFWVLRQIPMH